MKRTKTLKIAVAAIAAALFMAQPAFAANLTGAGSTFAIPLLDSCKAGFAAATGDSFTYTGGGSGAGRSASDKGIGDFNFSDTPHTGATKLATVIHAPVIAAPVAVMFNIGTIKSLNLSPETIAGIFGGTITDWNDPAILADTNRTYETVTFKKDKDGAVLKDKNGAPIVQSTRKVTTHVTMPAKKIQIIYRSDSSGTTGVFTNFLFGMAPKIWTKPGNNTFTTTFPGQINSVTNLGRIVGASGSAAVSALAKRTPYSITYAEKNYASANNLKLVNVKNAAGNYQAPDSGGTSAFLGAAKIDADSGVLTFDYNTKVEGAYPIGTVAYALVDTKTTNAAALRGFLTYVLSSKCASADPSLEYTTITGPLQVAALAQIAKIGK